MSNIFRIIDFTPFKTDTFICVCNYFEESKSNEIWHYPDSKNIEFYKDKNAVGVWKIKKLKK